MKNVSGSSLTLTGISLFVFSMCALISAIAMIRYHGVWEVTTPFFVGVTNLIVAFTQKNNLKPYLRWILILSGIVAMMSVVTYLVNHN